MCVCLGKHGVSEFVSFLLIKECNSIHTSYMRKSAGPDVICGHTLCFCADQLSVVLNKLFQMCAERNQTLTILKMPRNLGTSDHLHLYGAPQIFSCLDSLPSYFTVNDLISF